MNPDGDLESMASRMLSFYRYWLPKWDGIYNEKPSHEQFCNLLQEADIFAYIFNSLLLLISFKRKTKFLVTMATEMVRTL